MQVNEALNKAIAEIEAQFKSAGITGVKLDWWSNNDAPDVFITFPNDVDADGKPFINKNYDDRRFAFEINIKKIDSVESALKEISSKVKKYENDIYEDALCFESDEPFSDDKYKAYFEKIFQILKNK